MNTFLSKYFLVFCSALGVASCNKKSVIEGVNTKPVITIIDTTISMYSKKIDEIRINIEGNPGIISVYTERATGVSGIGYSVNDSLRSTRISIHINSGLLSFYFGEASQEIRKYVKNDTMFSTSIQSAYYYNLVFSKRTPPFNSETKFISINGDYYNPFSTTYNDKSIRKFELLSDGYIMFKAVKIGTPSITYYGWIHIIVNQNSITLDKYGYQPMKALKAGEED